MNFFACTACSLCIYAGAMIRDMQPQKKAADFVEFAAAYGTDHLRSYEVDLPLYQHIDLDIFLTLFAIGKTP